MSSDEKSINHDKAEDQLPPSSDAAPPQQGQEVIIPQGIVAPSTFETNMNIPRIFFIELFKRLSILDRLLTPLIIFAMIIGVIIGEFAPHVQQAFDTVRFDSVSVRAYTHR
jgi:hypothetical protein